MVIRGAQKKKKMRVEEPEWTILFDPFQSYSYKI